MITLAILEELFYYLNNKAADHIFKRVIMGCIKA